MTTLEKICDWCYENSEAIGRGTFVFFLIIGMVGGALVGDIFFSASWQMACLLSFVGGIIAFLVYKLALVVFFAWLWFPRF